MNNKNNKLKQWWKNHAPSKRRLIQVYSALLFNAYLKGYITGNIFKGDTKNICTPGLNCYSCPGAVTSCPLGALQNAFASSGKTAPYYMLGIILIYSIMFGRWICGWLCPFGFVQDILHKIKTPKLVKNKITRVLSFFKYIILVLFVVILPLIYIVRDLPLPAFCKYICPAGTFGGALGLLINPANSETFRMLGPLFTWKFALMVSFLVGAVFIYRVFCRFFCPLGALYGIFNKISLFGIKLDKKACINCGKCVGKCKMDIREVGDHECIMCGECINVCPTNAISYRGSKIILPRNEIDKNDPSYEEENNKRNEKKRLITGGVATLLTLVLVGVLVYFNFLHDKPTEAPDITVEEPENTENNNIPIGSSVGERCPSYSLDLVNGEGKVNIKDMRGKVVVVNFWGTWCGPCKAELPHFNELASEYADEVVILTVHSVFNRNSKAEAPSYIQTNYPDSKMIFAYDLPLDSYTDMYFDLLGGTNSYPRTVVLDKDGIITFAKDGSMTYAQLKAVVDAALAK